MTLARGGILPQIYRFDRSRDDRHPSNSSNLDPDAAKWVGQSVYGDVTALAIGRRTGVPARRAALQPVVFVDEHVAPLTLEDFVAERGEQLLRLAYLVTGNHADAEDLLQETLVEVHRKWSRVSDSDHPYAYVRAMLNNKFISSRRRKWHGEHPTDPVDVAVLDRSTTDPTRAVDGQDAMWRLLETLPPKMRAVLVLRYFEDLSDAEIADALEIGVSTVRANASRALAQLRTKGEIAR